MPAERRGQVIAVGIGSTGNGRSLTPNGRRQPSCGDTSRMTRECQVRICERLGVQFLGATRQASRGWTRMPVRSVRGRRATWQAVAVVNQRSRERDSPRETDCGGIGSVEPVCTWRRPCRHRELGRYDVRTPRGRRGRHVRKECAAKARNHSRVASALPHSEDIAYKPPCGEIAMCPRVGRMGSIK